MGQRNRRQKLDPYFGENKTLLQTLIEKDETFNNPKNVYLAAFIALQLKPIVVIDAVNYDKVIVSGFSEKEDFPVYINSYKEEVFKTDFSICNVMIISVIAGSSLIVTIEKSKIAKSLEWAEYKELTLKTDNSLPKRIANYDLVGVE